MTLNIEQPAYLEGYMMAFIGQRTPHTYGKLYALDELEITAPAR